MKEKELKITVENGIKQLVIREGEAEKIKYPVKQSWDGTIYAASEFLKTRKAEQVDPKKAIVVFDVLAMTLCLYVDKSDEIAPVINGKLSMNPDLMEFAINSTSARKKSKELSHLLRMRRIFFKSKEECDATVNRFQNFKATITTELEKANDQRGSQREKLEQSLAEKVDVKFMLSLPIFKGEKPVDFQVEVMCEIVGADVLFWLESQQLQELIVMEREAIIQKALMPFVENYVCIQQ